MKSYLDVCKLSAKNEFSNLHILSRFDFSNMQIEFRVPLTDVTIKSMDIARYSLAAVVPV